MNVAQMFNDKIGIDGVILTKLDGDTRGGAALSIKAVPVASRFCMQVWVRSCLIWNSSIRIVWRSRILGMGDVLTLIEKAAGESR